MIDNKSGAGGVIGSTEVAKAAPDLPATRERFTQMTGSPAWTTPTAFGAFVNEQIARWKGVIEKEGLQFDVS